MLSLIYISHGHHKTLHDEVSPQDGLQSVGPSHFWQILSFVSADELMFPVKDLKFSSSCALKII